MTWEETNRRFSILRETHEQFDRGTAVGELWTDDLIPLFGSQESFERAVAHHVETVSLAVEQPTRRRGRHHRVVTASIWLAGIGAVVAAPWWRDSGAAEGDATVAGTSVSMTTTGPELTLYAAMLCAFVLVNVVIALRRHASSLGRPIHDVR